MPTTIRDCPDCLEDGRPTGTLGMQRDGLPILCGTCHGTGEDPPGDPWSLDSTPVREAVANAVWVLDLWLPHVATLKPEAVAGIMVALRKTLGDALATRDGREAAHPQGDQE